MQDRGQSRPNRLIEFFHDPSGTKASWAALLGFKFRAKLLLDAGSARLNACASLAG